jgi:hypothetical protein
MLILNLNTALFTLLFASTAVLAGYEGVHGGGESDVDCFVDKCPQLGEGAECLYPLSVSYYCLCCPCVTEYEL